MLVNGLTFEAFASLLPDGFNIVQPKIRRRSKGLDKFLSFARKSELLVARRLED
jgi:hypothetical protein